MPILNWLTREKDVRATRGVPYRLLEEVKDLGYGDLDSGNMLIQGDNLDALKALLPFYAGQVQCVYIDPPFNTGQAFEKYDDNLEHSIWLRMMYPALEMFAELLADTGSIFIHLDDNEIDYCKVICDEIFGRKNFVQRIVLKARSPSAFSTVNPGVFKASEYMLWYAKKKTRLYQKRLWVPRAPDTAYNKFISNIGDRYSQWILEPLGPRLSEEIKKARTPQAVTSAVSDFYVKYAKNIVRLAEIDDEGAGQDIVDVKRVSAQASDKIFSHSRDGYEDIFILNGQQILFYEKNIREIDGVRTPARMLTNIWDDIAWEGIAREGGVRLPKAKKPERLIRRCLDLTTKPGDLVFDSFLGSGTTAAVAIKMRRRVVGIERGNQAETLCQKRLASVVKGDSTGVSSLEGWQGGSGFRFYRLGSPVFDENGRVCPDIKFPVLAGHVWFSETGFALSRRAGKTPLLGIDKERAVALLYNGILGEKSSSGGNVLTRVTLRVIREAIKRAAPKWSGQLVVYGERTTLTPSTLERENIHFKQTPYDVKARR